MIFSNSNFSDSKFAFTSLIFDSIFRRLFSSALCFLSISCCRLNFDMLFLLLSVKHVQNLLTFLRVQDIHLLFLYPHWLFQILLPDWNGYIPRVFMMSMVRFRSPLVSNDFRSIHVSISDETPRSVSTRPMIRSEVESVVISIFFRKSMSLVSMDLTSSFVPTFIRFEIGSNITTSGLNSLNNFMHVN